MTSALTVLARRTANALRDLAPIILVIAFFQIVVLQQPFPNLGSIVVGLLCVIAGLTLFIQGLESGLFPLGEAIAQAFAHKGSAAALLGFAFCLGFGTTVAEPALIAVAAEAAEVASQAGAIADDEQARIEYAFELRMVVAFAVGAAIVLGVLRILKGWPIHRLIIGGLRSRDDHDRLRAGREHRCRLRFRRRHHQHHHGAAGHGARGRARHVDQGAQPHDRRLRAHRVRERLPYHVRAGLLDGRVLGEPPARCTPSRGDLSHATGVDRRCAVPSRAVCIVSTETEAMRPKP